MLLFGAACLGKPAKNQPSDIPAWEIRDVCNKIYAHLTFLFFEYIKNINFHNKLKKAIICNNTQKDEPELTEIYRPISITGALAKEIDKCLNKQIDDYLLSQNLLSNTQFGSETPIQQLKLFYFPPHFSECQLIAIIFLLAHC